MTRCAETRDLRCLAPGIQTDPATPCPHDPIFPDNVIPADKIDPIGQAILNLYPHANITGAAYPDPNWRQVIIGNDPGWQFDVKLDHQFTANHRIGGRYSRHHDQSTAPTVVGKRSGRWHDLHDERAEWRRGIQLVRHSDCTLDQPLQRGSRACPRRQQQLPDAKRCGSIAGPRRQRAHPHADDRSR